MKENSANLSAS